MTAQNAFRLSVVGMLGALWLTACLPPRETPPSLDQARPSQNADLPYRFSIDELEVVVSSTELTTSVSAFGQTVEDPIDDDERWLAVSVTLSDQQGRERLFPAETLVRLRNALGMILPAPHTLVAQETANPSDLQKLAPNEKKEMRVFFHVKRGDFPIELIFADGAAAPLGQ